MEQQEKPPVVYAAQANSPSLSGDVRLTVFENALNAASLFSAEELPYARTKSLTRENYGVKVDTDGGVYRFLRMGSEDEPFYDALYAAYNGKVRKALFVSGTPLKKAQGEYRFSERGAFLEGAAPIEVYEDCVLFLPPNEDARRVPLSFVTALEKGAFSLTLRIGAEESYTFSKLGYDTETFADAVEKQLRALRESAIRDAKEAEPTLTMAQASAIAKLTPRGVAVSLGALCAISPAYVAALEGEIGESRSAREFDVLKAACGLENLYAGRMKRFEQRSADDTDASEEEGQEKNMLWLIAPGKSGNTAAVEFAVAEGESAATFLYRFEGGFDAFVRAFNRALEAISFKREAVRLSEEELQKPEYADIAMAVRRNGALRYIRAAFAGRVTHASLERWKESVLGHLGE